MLQFVLIGWWFGLWRSLNDESTISYAGFLVDFAFTLAFFMAVRFLIVDIERSQKVDLKTHFGQVRIPFFICVAFPYVLFVALGWLNSDETGTPIGDIVSIIVQIAIPIAGALVANERAQAAFVLVYGFTYLIVEFQQYGVGFG